MAASKHHKTQEKRAKKKSFLSKMRCAVWSVSWEGWLWRGLIPANTALRSSHLGIPLWEASGEQRGLICCWFPEETPDFGEMNTISKPAASAAAD